MESSPYPGEIQPLSRLARPLRWSLHERGNQRREQGEDRMKEYRAIAVVALAYDAPGVIGYGDTMLKILGNQLFANSPLTAANFKLHLDDLRAKQAARRGGPAAIAARNSALQLVRLDIEGFRVFVQQLADATPDKAAEIITAAGMRVKKVRVTNKPDFEMRQGDASGSAVAIAKSRGKGTTYWWAFSSDQKSWTVTTPTRTASQSFANLTPGTMYYFRFQTLTKDGLSDWSQIVAFMVK
jgi:hypothetical protein